MRHFKRRKMTVGEALMWSTQWLSRFAVALGGFLIFMGIVIIGVFILFFFGFVDIGIFESEKYRMLSIWALLAIGALDLVSGIILRRR
jgi:hypothetical protein